MKKSLNFHVLKSHCYPIRTLMHMPSLRERVSNVKYEVKIIIYRKGMGAVWKGGVLFLTRA